MSSEPMSFVRRWSWLFVFGGLVLAVALLSLLGGESPWADVTPDRINDYRTEQCERVDVHAYFLQFHNFWSNFTYLAGGLLILFFNRSMPGWFVGGAMCFLGFGSAYFHGTLTGLGQTVDIIGVYGVLFTIAVYGFIEIMDWRYDTPQAWTMMCLAVMLAVFGGFGRGHYFFKSEVGVGIFVVIILAWIVVGAIIPKARRGLIPVSIIKMWLAAGIVGLAGFFALLGKFTDGTDNGPLADNHGFYPACLYGPGSVIQGHALWHVLSGIMFMAMFEYFRLMRERTPSPFPWDHR